MIFIHLPGQCCGREKISAGGRYSRSLFEVSLELKNVNILASRSAWISRKMQEESSYARILSFLVTSVHDRTKGRLVSPIVPLTTKTDMPR